MQVVGGFVVKPLRSRKSERKPVKPKISAVMIVIVWFGAALRLVAQPSAVQLAAADAGQLATVIYEFKLAPVRWS